MSRLDSEEEHRVVSSDDEDSTLPEAFFPFTHRKEHKSEARRPSTQNGRLNTTTWTTPPRPPPLVHSVNVALPPTPSPVKEITDEESARLRKTEQLAKKVKELNTKCKEQVEKLENPKMDEDIRRFLRDGVIVAMEQQRHEQVEKENQMSQST